MRKLNEVISMKKCTFFGVFLAVALFFVQLGAAEAAGWYWLSSNDKYSKYFDPASVTIESSTPTSHGTVATEIAAWTKTGYSYEGAAETLANYAVFGVKDYINDPAKLSYSLALVYINPQNRLLQYKQERFCDEAGNVLWEKKTPGSVKEMTSQEFDEDFYDAIVDQVFGAGEVDRAKAEDRWLTLWETVNVDGIRSHAQEDTTTMRMKGNQLIGWQWITTKDANGTTLEIKFLKTAINLAQGTERVISGKYWAKGYSGFQDMSEELDGQYHMITPRSPEAKGLVVLRSYAKSNADWLNRYSIED